jgi:hypothetical protein
MSDAPYTITRHDSTWWYVLDVVAAHLAGAAVASGEYPTRRTAEDAARLALGLEA